MALKLTNYPAAMASLLEETRLPELGPGQPNRSAYERLQKLRIEDLFPRQADRLMAQACLSGLWLYHDYLDESHTISQDIPGPTGSYWHALMHRREPDAWNSKYWFRQVGHHPVLDDLVQQAPIFGYTYTDPYNFVDFVEEVRGKGTAEEEQAKQVQQLEWELLFDWCYNQAVRV